VGKKLLIFLLLISCTPTSNAVLLENSSEDMAVVNEVVETKSQTSEEILIEIFNAYKKFSENPALTIDIIWNYAHEDNREATGPKERFSMMLTSEPYDSIVDLKDYSYEIIFESDENIHYEVKVLAKNNNYFVITWVFEKTLCEEKPCWRTIGVSQPKFFDYGI
tara:strand:- start:53 stop:544 length:492 start_codon:yes stop_codon:yes gene_type:complete